MKLPKIHRLRTAFLALLGLTIPTLAYSESSNSLFYGIDNFDAAIFFLGSVLGLLFIVTMAVILTLYWIVNKKLIANAGLEEEKVTFWKWFYEKFNAAAPVAKEADMLLQHDYDGIRELDNDLPPWWKWGFYITIIFSFVYMFVYHSGEYDEDISVKEYQAEMVSAEKAKAEYLAKMANLIDETNVEIATDDLSLGNGQTLFTQNCKACHGGSGEGGVGPNLTDEYWLHGGDIADVFTTVKYGVPQNGMLPWQSKLTPKQMQEVSSYILSLQGTNPPGAKEPQGEKYSPKS